MVGDRYVVKKGDHLWGIAARTLGGGRQWPRIWRYNNRREVVRVTGRAIPNPDLIYPDQVLLIPRLPTTPVAPSTGAPSPASPPTAVPGAGAGGGVGPGQGGGAPSLSQQAQTVKLPAAFKYRLDDLRWPPQDLGVAVVEVRMTGDVLLMSKRSYPATFITSRGEVEAQLVSEANHAFGKLVSDSRYIYDPLEKRVTMRTMLVSQSTTPGTVATAIGVEVSSNSPVPKLRAEIRLPKLEGSYGPFRYIALDAKVVVEVTPKARIQPPSMQPERVRLPVTAAPPQRSPVAWDRVIGTGLVVTAGVIVVATVVEDFLTLGAGVADDPASFAGAGLALARGLAMLRGASALPRAAFAANLTLTSGVALAP